MRVTELDNRGEVGPNKEYETRPIRNSNVAKDPSTRNLERMTLRLGSPNHNLFCPVTSEYQAQAE